MSFLFNKYSHFNAANLITMGNITFGLTAVYYVTQENFFAAIILAWLGGLFDIFDGKVARKYKLSTEFGIQMDSFADFLTFVLMPTFLIFQEVYANESLIIKAMGGLVGIYYVIAGLRRLIQFNINAEEGEVEGYFTGIPTPLGAILLWLVFLAEHTYQILPFYGVMALTLLIGILLNSKVKIKHL